jgi:hypothetical protein
MLPAPGVEAHLPQERKQPAFQSARVGVLLAGASGATVQLDHDGLGLSWAWYETTSRAIECGEVDVGLGCKLVAEWRHGIIPPKVVHA